MLLTHKGTRRIVTDRLELRRFEVGDAKAMYENWASDPEVTKYLTWPCHESVEATEGILREWVGRYEDADCYIWGMVPKEIGEPIGCISVVKQDEDIGMLQIGYCIGQKCWGQGYTPEALRAVIRYLFDEVGANRVEARHDPNNPNSGKVMLKCGMLYEGTMRQAGRNNQGICDESMYAILAGE